MLFRSVEREAIALGLPAAESVNLRSDLQERAHKEALLRVLDELITSFADWPLALAVAPPDSELILGDNPAIPYVYEARGPALPIWSSPASANGVVLPISPRHLLLFNSDQTAAGGTYDLSVGNVQAWNWLQFVGADAVVFSRTQFSPKPSDWWTKMVDPRRRVMREQPPG